MARIEIWTLSGVENWARMPPAALDVEPAPGNGSFSSTTTSLTPRRPSQNAIEAPMQPAPITTTEAVVGGPSAGTIAGGPLLIPASGTRAPAGGRRLPGSDSRR